MGWELFFLIYSGMVWDGMGIKNVLRITYHRLDWIVQYIKSSASESVVIKHVLPPPITAWRIKTSHTMQEIGRASDCTCISFSPSRYAKLNDVGNR